MNAPIKSISAVKSRPNGRTNGRSYAKAKKSDGHDVLWKRLTSTIDEAMAEAKRLPPDQLDKAIAVMAAGAKLTSPISRAVFLGHLTVTQGMAARRYADVVSKFEHFFVDKAQRSARAQNFQPVRGGEDETIQRHLVNGTINDYEREARKARRQYERAMTVLDRYASSVTGRNEAKNILDDFCLSDIWPPQQYQQNLAAVLQALAQAFGVKESR